MKLKGSTALNRMQIEQVASRGLNSVHFSKTLERIYQEQYKNEAAYEFRFRGLIILILYLFLSFGIYQTISNNDIMQQWLTYYAWVGIIVITAWILSFFKKFNQYFDYYTGFGSMAAITISFIIITNIGADPNNTAQNDVLFHTAMMYAVVITYSFVGMRFYTAVIVCWMGGLIAIFISIWSNQEIGWTLLNRTYTFYSFLGMALTYAIDRQHRENYLQNCIIELNQIELTQQAQQLALLSQLDSLTGLANRRYLNEVLDKEWRYALRHQTPLSILMVDIDFFKNYNDHLGHIAGDQCLQLIADAIHSITARSNDLAARYGGEEFLLVFPMTDQQQAEALTIRLLQLIEAAAIPHPSNPISEHVTISVGISTIIPQAHDQISELISLADRALYLAKNEGRNRYHIAEPYDETTATPMTNKHILL